MTAFTEVALERQGFVGWLPFRDATSADVPAHPGVYVVTYAAGDPLEYPAASCGGRFKGRNPAVPHAHLVANWVCGAEVVYIAKANDLRRRLRELANFGAGKPAPHWGGRLIWQLPDVGALRVAWKETLVRDPRTEEADYIEAFRAAYGKPPFANYPNRMGA